MCLIGDPCGIQKVIRVLVSRLRLLPVLHRFVRVDKFLRFEEQRQERNQSQQTRWGLLSRPWAVQVFGAAGAEAGLTGPAVGSATGTG